ncbi:hypothetical protein DM860_002141 [Cuscuta australis]|uniref:Uncharacterized protein n=1 Tax=Cuscuta australis TaxID=267555 RepID=A0A328DXB9_9ASTE|nr:hypothetical protein DM860_002141 [Cuscuta australis]
MFREGEEGLGKGKKGMGMGNPDGERGIKRGEKRNYDANSHRRRHRLKRAEQPELPPSSSSIRRSSCAAISDGSCAQLPASALIVLFDLYPISSILEGSVHMSIILLGTIGSVLGSIRCNWIVIGYVGRCGYWMICWALGLGLGQLGQLSELAAGLPGGGQPPDGPGLVVWVVGLVRRVSGLIRWRLYCYRTCSGPEDGVLSPEFATQLCLLNVT